MQEGVGLWGANAVVSMLLWLGLMPGRSRGVEGSGEGGG